MKALTDEQLKAMEASAPLLVSAYKEMQARAYDLHRLASRCIYTMRSGIIAASSVEEMTTEAERLNVYKRP